MSVCCRAIPSFISCWHFGSFIGLSKQKLCYSKKLEYRPQQSADQHSKEKPNKHIANGVFKESFHARPAKHFRTAAP